MQQTIDYVKSFQDWTVAQLPEAVMGLLSAVATLIVVLLAYKITSRLITRARYQTVATERERISSDIVGEIVKVFGHSGKLGFAYPHSAVEYKAVDGTSLPPMFREVALGGKG